MGRYFTPVCLLGMLSACTAQAPNTSPPQPLIDSDANRAKLSIGTAKPKKTARLQPTPLSPPFLVLAVESRAGERFLATAPQGSRSLADIRLLHSGEHIGAWRLKALEPRAALFAVTGQPDQTVPLP